MKSSAWLIGAAGAWLAASPFLGFVPPESRWNDLAVGIIVGVLGARTARAKRTYGWVAAALGVWLLGVASLSAKAALGAVWHDLAVGAVLAVVGLVGLASEGPAPPVDLFPRPPRVGELLHRHLVRVPDEQRVTRKDRTMASEARVSRASGQPGTLAAALGDFSVDQVESLVCVEWLGARSYNRPHSRRLVRALIAYALAPDSPIRDYIVERHVHLELLMLGTYGMGRPAVLNQFASLSRAVRTVVASIGAWPKLADRIDARLQESLAPLGKWASDGALVA